MTDCLWEGPLRCSPFIANHHPCPGCACFQLSPSSDTLRAQDSLRDLPGRFPTSMFCALPALLLKRPATPRLPSLVFGSPIPISNQKLISILRNMESKKLDMFTVSLGILGHCPGNGGSRPRAHVSYPSCLKSAGCIQSCGARSLEGTCWTQG